MHRQVEIVEASRGGRVAVLDGYIFYKNKDTKSGIRWACSKRKTSKCLACVSYSERNVVRFDHDHSHPPNLGEVESMRLKANTRKRSRDETLPVQVIYEQEKVN